MKKGLSELILILDMSGSMSGMRDDTIGGYNTLIEEQKKVDGEARVTTVLFDDRYILLHDREDLNDIEPLTDKEYSPRGMTAMLDAIGHTISSVGQKLSEMPEDERPESVMVTIITDGYENASREYTWDAVQSMIREQREKYNWIFTFIGADIDTIKVGKDLGIDSKLTRGYTKSSVGTASVYTAMSASMSRMRTTDADYETMLDSVAEEMEAIK